MFFLGIVLGFLLGANLGVLFMALFKVRGE